MARPRDPGSPLDPPSQRRDAAPDTYGGALDGHIRGWRPTGEPDLPADDYLQRVF